MTGRGHAPPLATLLAAWALLLALAAPAVAQQDRVASELGEESTDGYVTADIEGGVRVYEGLQLRLGVQNLADEHYANHLNAKNPFTGDQIPEPGRVLYADLSWAFGPIR